MSHLVEWSDEAFEIMATAHVAADAERAFEALRKESGLTPTLDHGVIRLPPAATVMEYGNPDAPASPFILGVLSRL